MEGYADFLYRSALDEVLELKRDILTALATIHELINSFAPINCISSDVLSLIPTHLPDLGDRFRATFVCRHWRRTFLQYAPLWSRLDLSKGKVYAKTILERAKGSPLSILASGVESVGTIVLLPPYVKQITDLEFTNSHWAYIRRFSGISSGPLPLLRTLTINAIQGLGPDGPPFSGAVDLKELRLRSKSSLSLRDFVFPNLTFFELSMASEEGFPGLQLLDFLEASPMLRTVRTKVIAPISLEGIPQDRVVVLHNVESLYLVAREGGPCYKLATHISCPSAKHTSLTHTREKRRYLHTLQERFPTSASLNAIIPQYTRNSTEEVTLEIKTDSDYLIACSLTFRSADTTVNRLCFEVSRGGGHSFTVEWEESFINDVVSEASRIIQNLPSRAGRLHVYGYPRLDPDSRQIKRVANELGQLIQSMGPLEELTICCCDVRPYFFPFSHPKRFGFEGLVVYPPVKVLSISHPLYASRGNLAVGLVNLARAQHELEIPFECVTVRMYDPPADMEERLRPWVGVVDCRVLGKEG